MQIRFFRFLELNLLIIKKRFLHKGLPGLAAGEPLVSSDKQIKKDEVRNLVVP